MMQEPIRWGSDARKAMDEAKSTGKLALLFFHSDQCSGCKAMIAKTLPDPKVSKFISRMLVPAMFEVSEPGSQELMRKYGAQWTPTFVITDSGGNVVHDWVGYLPPGDFCAEMLFAEGRAAFKNKAWDRAEKCYGAVADKFPGSEKAPEALYYTGVARYERTHDATHLEDTRKILRAKYPDSSWAKKASVWGE